MQPSLTYCVLLTAPVRLAHSISHGTQLATDRNFRCRWIRAIRPWNFLFLGLMRLSSQCCRPPRCPPCPCRAPCLMQSPMQAGEEGGNGVAACGGECAGWWRRRGEVEAPPPCPV